MGTEERRNLIDWYRKPSLSPRQPFYTKLAHFGTKIKFQVDVVSSEGGMQEESGDSVNNFVAVPKGQLRSTGATKGGVRFG